MASLQSKYDHATELAARQPPVVKLAYLVNELKGWATANPGPLQILHSEFAGLLREMREASQASAGTGGPASAGALLEALQELAAREPGSMNGDVLMPPWDGNGPYTRWDGGLSAGHESVTLEKGES